MKLAADPAVSPLTEGGETDILCESSNHTQVCANCRATGVASALLLFFITALIATFIVMIIEATGIRRMVQGAAYTLQQVLHEVRKIDERSKANGFN